MTAKVCDGTYWSDKNILYLHYGGSSVIINICQNPSKYMSGSLLYAHCISIKLIFFFFLKKQFSSRDPEVITSIYEFSICIIIKDIMFTVQDLKI